MKKILILLVAFVILSGCAHRSDYVWVRPGSTEQEFNVDKYQCQIEAQTQVNQAPINYNEPISAAVARRRIANQWFQSCMQSKGWSKRYVTKQEKVSSPELKSIVQIENVVARYPKYRIEQIKKMCILGNGVGENEISGQISNLFLRRTNVRIIEPGNLQALLGGKILEYSTGLTQAESQALSQMLQIDHLLLFEEKVSPHSDYINGGRAFVQISMKIINTINGEIIWQSITNQGAVYKNPAQYGYSSINEITTSNVNELRMRCISIIAHELLYAMGQGYLGIYTGEDVRIRTILVNSIAERAGLKMNDRILTVNGIEINNREDLPILKQGEESIIKINRDGNLIEIRVIPPLVPFRPIEEEQKEKKKGAELMSIR